MVATRIGGIKTRDKNLARNPNFYREIGKKGESVLGKKGFAIDPELARRAGAKGGSISKRPPRKKKEYTHDK
jgi:hypothetical protein